MYNADCQSGVPSACAGAGAGAGEFLRLICGCVSRCLSALLLQLFLFLGIVLFLEIENCDLLQSQYRNDVQHYGKMSVP